MRFVLETSGCFTEYLKDEVLIALFMFVLIY